jgi:hypothetical protein
LRPVSLSSARVSPVGVMAGSFSKGLPFINLRRRIAFHKAEL